jgi:hypothetical protein
MLLAHELTAGFHFDLNLPSGDCGRTSPASEEQKSSDASG